MHAHAVVAPGGQSPAKSHTRVALAVMVNSESARHIVWHECVGVRVEDWFEQREGRPIGPRAGRQVASD